MNRNGMHSAPNMKIVMKIVMAIVLLAAVAALASCALVDSPALGGLYTDVRHGTNLGERAASASKQGSACAQSYVGLVATGDASIETARQNGEITQIAYVDHSSKVILLVYGEYCTIVYGE